ILFLHSSLEELRHLTRLPAALESLELFGSEVALKFALGHEGEVPNELLGIDRLEPANKEEILNHFRLWRDQPAGKELPKTISLANGRSTQLSSQVLGCSITAEASNESPCTELAETILAGIEALLSTGFLHGIVAHESEL